KCGAVAAGGLLIDNEKLNVRVKSLKQPNILMIVSDDHGWGDLPSNWPATDAQLPVMEAVGDNGVRFTDFYVCPLCGPTRAMVLTGQYSMENGMWRGPSGESEGNNARRIHSDVRMLPEMLSDAGYATGIFGKWHLGYEEGNIPNDRGFDVFYGFLGGAHPYLSGSKLMHNRQPYSEGKHLTDYFTEKAMDFIRAKGKGDKPFFCYVPYNAVHGPTWREEAPNNSGKAEWLEKVEDRGIDNPRRDYLAILEHMDDSAGRLLDLIAELGIEDDTLVLYFSDNGGCIMTEETKANYPGNNGLYRAGKGNVYEGGVRVPCVMQWKGRFPKGVVSDDVVIGADVFSTVLDAAGIDVPKMNGKNPVRGVSLLPHIESDGRQGVGERTIFFELTGKVGCRSRGMKMVTQIESSRAQWDETVAQLKEADFELYDLSSDPGERTDLRLQRPETYSALKQKIIEYFENIE
ncbi:MAG: sulfatase-like hydrolase/transferase, partial [Planctomycetes bacterium]|nr:sulfatase-like hydrolase/transferase [Planctomycetota bacterium]